jgi:hypothetical protein
MDYKQQYLNQVMNLWSIEVTMERGFLLRPPIQTLTAAKTAQLL